MRLFYLVAMETDLDSCISCRLDAKIAMFLHILRCKLEKSSDWPYFVYGNILKVLFTLSSMQKKFQISLTVFEILQFKVRTPQAAK